MFSVLSRRDLFAGASALAAATALIGPSFSARAASSPIGSVKRMRGTAQVAREGGISAIAQGNPVYANDRLTTGTDSRLELAFADATELTLGDGTELVIDEFVYAPDQQKGRAAFSLATGVFRAVTGGIGKLQDRPFTVATKVGTIGIRGTDFWGDVGANKLFLALLGGAGVYVRNDAGEFGLSETGTAILVTSRTGRPAPAQRLTAEQLAAAQRTVAF